MIEESVTIHLGEQSVLGRCLLALQNLLLSVLMDETFVKDNPAYEKMQLSYKLAHGSIGLPQKRCVRSGLHAHRAFSHALQRKCWLLVP